MPLKLSDKSIGAIYKGDTPISAIYKGDTLVFSAFTWEQWYSQYVYHTLVPTTINSKVVKNKAKVLKIEANGEVVNQLVDFDNNSFNNDNPNIYSLAKENANKTITLTGISSGSARNKMIFSHRDSVKNNYYLLTYDIISSISFDLDTSTVVYDSSYLVSNISQVNANQKARVVMIAKSNVNGVVQWYIARGLTNWAIGDVMTFSNIQLTDLTHEFGTGNEPTSLTDTRIQKIINGGYIPYNTGEYKGTSISEISSYDSNDTLLQILPFIYQGNGALSSKDSLDITNTEYVFTKNQHIVDLSTITFTYNSTYNYYEYYNYSNTLPHFATNSVNEVGNALYDKCATTSRTALRDNTSANGISVHTSDTDYITLRNSNVSQASDINGKLTYQLATPQVIRIPRKHLGVVDLGTLNWEDYSYGFYSQGISSIAKKFAWGELSNCYCSLYKTEPFGNIYGQTVDMAIAINPSGYVAIRDTSKSSLTVTQFKTAMSGKYLFYETQDEVADILTQFKIESGGNINTNSEVLPDMTLGVACK